MEHEVQQQELQESAFADISVHKDLKEYLEAVAKELNTEVHTLLTSLVFDGLAYNLLRSLVEERGMTLDEVVLRFLNNADNGNGELAVEELEEDNEHNEDEDVPFQVDTDNDES